MKTGFCVIRKCNNIVSSGFLETRLDGQQIAADAHRQLRNGTGVFVELL